MCIISFIIIVFIFNDLHPDVLHTHVIYVLFICMYITYN